MSTVASFKILFVCLGNICRSPAAEGVMQKKIHKTDLADIIHVDSAGTAGWHTGNLPDERMRTAAAARDYQLTSRARQVHSRDFEEFDLILAMDEQNRLDLRTFDPQGLYTRKLRLFCEFCADHDEKEVPDPYYGGSEGFEKVLDLLEDGCDNLLSYVAQQIGYKSEFTD